MAEMTSLGKYEVRRELGRGLVGQTVDEVGAQVDGEEDGEPEETEAEDRTDPGRAGPQPAEPATRPPRAPVQA